MRWAVLTIGLAAALAFAVAGRTAEKGEKDSTAAAKCPVTGAPISKDASVEYKGGKLYFCCPDCAAKFAKNKAKYATKANLQLVQTGQAKQKACPLTGAPVDDSTAIDVGGVKVAFCCGNCKAKVKEASAKAQLKMVFGDKAFDKAFAVSKD
jgi:YHS domain-containing protein